MTSQKQLKRRVRERMSKTGERYTAARRQLAAGRPHDDGADLAPALEMASDEKLTEATGHGWRRWISILDAWGARERTHGEIAAYLMAEHATPSWWTQAITVGYERARGLRRKHQQADGYTISASKTINVPVELLFEAFVDEEIRRGWLTDGALTLRTARPPRTARFDWGDGTTRILVTFDPKQPMKSTVYVSHERLPDQAAAELAKASWRQRVTALKTHLEGRPA